MPAHTSLLLGLMPEKEACVLNDVGPQEVREEFESFCS